LELFVIGNQGLLPLWLIEYEGCLRYLAYEIHRGYDLKELLTKGHYQNCLQAQILMRNCDLVERVLMVILKGKGDQRVDLGLRVT
jgi:hypothetical protein